MTSYLPSITFTPEDVDLTEKFIQIKNKGYYASGEQVTEVYNRVFKKNLSSTTCGSCIRQRITELEGALKIWQEKQNKAAGSDKSDEVEQSPTKAKKAPQKQNKKVKKE